MKSQGGYRLLVVFLLVLLSVNMGRSFFPGEEGPAFSFPDASGIMVEFGPGFAEAGVHQIIDGATWRDVIKMTGLRPDNSLMSRKDLDTVLQPGQRIDIDVKSDIIKELSVSWMSAAKRAALDIPLHPDRMSEEDWTFLPGIGPKLARRIVVNRQKYGEFHAFRSLRRVPGIGAKSLSRWNQYFFID